MIGFGGTVLHGVLEWLAVLVGARLYLRGSKLTLRGLGRDRQFAVLFGCVAGAAIGNKAVHWFHHAERWPLLLSAPWRVLEGQSIVGGLLGGLIGVELGKRHAGVRESTGDRFVVPILVGLLIGRIGCFQAGLDDDTYGIATRMPWGIDFGDGIARHPTQLYDMLFAVVALLALRTVRAELRREPGLEFKLMLTTYLAFRAAIDGLKPVPFAFFGGLSGIQVVCLGALVLYLPIVGRQLRRLRP